MRFKSHAHRNLDDKGRLILPPEFRDIIRENVPEGFIVLTIYGNQVIGITPAQWAHIEDEIEKIKSPSPELQETKLLLYSCYTEVPVSKQGRIAIPAHLRKSGNLGKEVVVMGAGPRFEIRPSDSFANLLGKVRDVSPELAENNVDLGI